VRLRQPRAEREAPRQSFVVAVVGGQRRAVPTTRVVEVARLDGWVTLPSDDPATLGVTFYRNQCLALVDLVPLTHAGPPRTSTLCLIARAGQGLVAVPVDEVCGLETSHGDALPEGAPLLNFESLDRIYGEIASR
jgi:chemotaxis signal transduction protein